MAGLFGEYSTEEIEKVTAPPAPWAAGFYPFTVTGAEPYEPKPGKEFGGIKATLEITHPETGRTMRRDNYLSFSPAAKGLNAQFLMAVGLNPNEFSDPAMLVGLAGQVGLKIVERRDGNGLANELGRFRLPNGKA